jgi:hypothetical protein
VKYSQEDKARIIAEVLGLLATSSSSVRKACQTAGVPDPTFLLWVSEDAALAEQYARAYKASCDIMADELLDIVDAEPERTQHGTIDGGDVANKRLRSDTRKWLLSKRRPSEYGERVQLAGDAENPLKVETTIDVSGLSIAALEELVNLRKK